MSMSPHSNREARKQALPTAMERKPVEAVQKDPKDVAPLMGKDS